MLDCIDNFLGSTRSLNEWRYLLQDHFDTLEPFFRSTKRYSNEWCCPYNGRKQLLCPEDSPYLPQFPGCHDQPCIDPRKIPLDELELLMFSSSLLAKKICTDLGLRAAPKKVGANVVRLGYLTFESARLPAFLLNCSVPHYQLHARAITSDHTDRCLFFTPRFCTVTADWLRQNRYGYFPLEDLLLDDTLTPSPAYWQVLQEFKSTLPLSATSPGSAVFIEPDFRRITFPDGYVLKLSRAPKRRAIVRFIHEYVTRTGNRVFDIEIVREAYNRNFPDKPWFSDRLREDLFKRNLADYDRLFETVDATLGRYRLKL